MEIRVRQIVGKKKVNVRVVKSHAVGHRTTVGHSMFIHTSKLGNLIQMRKAI